MVYKIIVTQGLEHTEMEYNNACSFTEALISLLGTCSFIIFINNKKRSLQDICKMFDLSYEAVLEVISLKMKLNLLYNKIRY